MRTDYERLAARYDEDRARWSVPADDVVTALLGSWTAARPVRVVDLGCGTGRWILPQRDALGAERVTWLGVDPSAAMLTEARRKGIAGLVRGRAEDLPLANASVDYVVSSFVFHHIVDKERAIDELDRVLVADRAVVRISNIEPAAARGWWVYEHFPEAVAVDAARFWPAERIADALAARGFEVDIDRSLDTTTIAVRDALEEAERRVVSQLAVLDDDAYRRGLARLRAIAVADPDATVPTTDSHLRVTARRR